MKGFLLQGEKQADHTLVSNVFLDEYMPAANGEYVKIYLYLLRCLESDTQELSISLIADQFDHTESDVRRALKYWEQLKLLHLEYDGAKRLTGVKLLEYQKEEAPAEALQKESLPDSSCSPGGKGRTDEPSGLREPLSEKESREILFICEQYLGKTLSPSEVERILYFHDELGFDADLIEYLVEYCVSKGHKSLRYIESVARGWHQDGCATVAQAKQQTNTYSKAYFTILKAFGISGRNPVEAEITYMKKWLKEYAFSTELISEACSRTIAAIHQPSFEYADKILRSWREKKVIRLSDLESLDSSHRAKNRTEASSRKKASASDRFHNYRERDYDFQELEKQLINK